MAGMCRRLWSRACGGCGEIGFFRSECGVMRNIIIVAAVAAGLGTIMAQTADKMTTNAALAKTASPTAAPVAAAAQSGSRNISIPPDGRGHFQTEGRIDGQRIQFMVDTGASVVALNER